MRCPHCPALIGELCRGEAIPHFCRLVNPVDPIYTPAFVRILVRDDVIVDQDLDRLDSAYAREGTEPRRDGGCGKPC